MVCLMNAFEFGYGSDKKFRQPFFIVYVSNDQFASIITAHD
jgi:hypothetical protein